MRLLQLLVAIGACLALRPAPVLTPKTSATRRDALLSLGVALAFAPRPAEADEPESDLARAMREAAEKKKVDPRTHG